MAHSCEHEQRGNADCKLLRERHQQVTSLDRKHYQFAVYMER